MGRRIKRVPAQPFVKWAGGKRSILPELMKRVPDDIESYYEPFVGGGALFFALAGERRPRFERAYLSDVNERLMRTYAAIAKDSSKVVKLLRDYASSHGKRFYAAVRKKNIDRSSSDAAVAAWMLYLNRTCYNGMYRVNKSGAFNVPIGDYKNPEIVHERNLLRCEMALKDGVFVATKPFEWPIRQATRGDFVYFDPPYYPLTKTSNFTSYTADKFDDADHVRLRDVARDLKARGVKVLISNSSADRVRELYGVGDFVIEEVQAARSVNSKTTGRGKITDLLIT